jgi:GNAT superfamily N-acetyltransferase
MTPVTVWSLEMTDPAAMRPATRPHPPVRTVEAPAPDARLSRTFYDLVGRQWRWVDRADWTDVQWTEWVSRPGHRLVTAWLDDEPAGYYELDAVDGEVEIAYFGLAERLIGRGCGGWLLTHALQRAWSLPDTRRVWVHTCSLDAPTALANYRARGMTLYDATVEWRDPAGRLIDPPSEQDVAAGE